MLTTRFRNFEKKLQAILLIIVKLTQKYSLFSHLNRSVMNTITPLIQISRRQISTSSVLNGKRNFRKFLLYNKRGTRLFKAERHLSNPDLPIDKRGVRDTGRMFGGKFVEIPEMIPELIVPDLTDCKFKPYVTYKATDVVQSEFTSQDLFNAVYAQKIIDDFKNEKLNEDGSSKEPSKNEELTPDESWIRARKTGSDIF